MSLDTQTKLAIYRHFAETGQRPSLEAVAESVGSDMSSVREARLRPQPFVLRCNGYKVTVALVVGACCGHPRKSPVGIEFCL